MDQSEHTTAAGAMTLSVTAANPTELIEAAMRGLLTAIRGDRPPATSADTDAVPVQGTGADLGELFVDLGRDLVAQIEEFGLDLDAFRLDGLLQTETGGYTAWGYLSGGAMTKGVTAVHLRIGDPEISEEDGTLRLTCDLNRA